MTGKAGGRGPFRQFEWRRRIIPVNSDNKGFVVVKIFVQ
jgi:hypothetical protein